MFGVYQLVSGSRALANTLAVDVHGVHSAPMGSPMRVYTGQPFVRADGRWEIRVRAGNHKIVFGSRQGYENYEDAVAVLVTLMHCGPHTVRTVDGTVIGGPSVWKRRRSGRRQPKPYVGWWERRPSDNKWETKVAAVNGDIIVTSVNQGFNNEVDAINPLETLLLHGPHVVLEADGTELHAGSRRSRRLKRRTPTVSA